MSSSQLDPTGLRDGEILLKAFTEHIKRAIRKRLDDELDTIIEELKTLAIEEAAASLRTSIQSRLEPMQNELVVLLQVNDGERKKVGP